MRTHESTRLIDRSALQHPELAVPAGTQKILIAEDSDLIRLLITRQLAMLGWACEGTRNGDEALQTWRRQPSRYWLLLTDLDMPHMNGFELSRCIRSENSAGARLPIVAYSGNARRIRPSSADAPESTSSSPSRPTCSNSTVCCSAGSGGRCRCAESTAERPLIKRERPARAGLCD